MEPQRYGSRWRILVAGLTMVIWMIVYTVMAVTFIGWLNANAIIEAVLYAVLGVAWILPMIRLFTWASKEDRGEI